MLRRAERMAATNPQARMHAHTRTHTKTYTYTYKNASVYRKTERERERERDGERRRQARTQTSTHHSTYLENACHFEKSEYKRCYATRTSVSPPHILLFYASLSLPFPFPFSDMSAKSSRRVRAQQIREVSDLLPSKLVYKKGSSTPNMTRRA